jgi:hypothetical protein
LGLRLREGQHWEDWWRGEEREKRAQRGMGELMRGKERGAGRRIATDKGRNNERWWGKDWLKHMPWGGSNEEAGANANEPPLSGGVQPPAAKKNSWRSMGGVGRGSQCWEKAGSSGEKQGKAVEKEPVWKDRVTAWGWRSGGAERDVLGSMLGKNPSIGSDIQLGCVGTSLD